MRHNGAMNHAFLHWLCLAWLCWLPVPALAQPAAQEHAALRAVAEAFARTQTQSVPGQVSITVQDLDARTHLPACDQLQAFLPPGAKLLGKTTIGVRCHTPAAWNVFLQAHIRVSTDRLVIARPLPQGHVLTTDDFTLQSGELEQPGILTTPSQAVGRTLKFALGAGQVLRQDMLHPQYVVRQGQVIKLVVRGAGYTVGSAGTALNDAEANHPVRVKTAAGHILSATAQSDGSAEVSP